MHGSKFKPKVHMNIINFQLHPFYKLYTRVKRVQRNPDKKQKLWCSDIQMLILKTNNRKSYEWLLTIDKKNTSFLKFINKCIENYMGTYIDV